MFGITIEKEERLPLALIAGGVLLFTGSIGALIGSIVTEKKNEKDDKDDEEEVEMQPEAVQPESSEKAVVNKQGESAEKIIRNMETAEKIKNMINPDNQNNYKTAQTAPAAEEVKESVTETKTVTEVVGEVVESEKDSVSSPAAETTTPPPAETVVVEKVDPKVIEIPPLAQPNHENIINNHFDSQAQAAMRSQAAMMQQQIQNIQQMQQPQVSPIPNPQNIIG